MLPFATKFLKGDETMDFWKRAQELKDEIIQNRRRIHQNAEVGVEPTEHKGVCDGKSCANTA